MMDAVYLAILAGGLALILGGARMIWCGHRASPERRHAERRTHPRERDRRRPA